MERPYDCHRIEERQTCESELMQGSRCEVKTDIAPRSFSLAYARLLNMKNEVVSTTTVRLVIPAEAGIQACSLPPRLDTRFRGYDGFLAPGSGDNSEPPIFKEAHGEKFFAPRDAA